MSTSKSRVLFAFANYWIQITIALIATGVLIWLACKYPDKGDSLQLAEAITGLITFLIALFVWFIQINREWKDSLGKRLTVQFEFKNKLVMKCEEAFLSGEADIRAWGQQLGQQMALGAFLKFDPYIRIEQSKKIRYNSYWDEYFVLYTATFYLTELPSWSKPNPTPEEKAEQAQWLENAKAEKCLEWIPKYSDDGTVGTVKGWNTQNLNRMRI